MTVTAPADTAQHWVLDTHVVLDWLLFDDPRTRFIGVAMAEGAACWLATPSMQLEFEQVLARKKFEHLPKDVNRIADAWVRWAQIGPEPAPAPWRCTDPDDQVFLDLALAARANALFTRDAALRRLAARARAQGLWIGPPEAWTARPMGLPGR